MALQFREREVAQRMECIGLAVLLHGAPMLTHDEARRVQRRHGRLQFLHELCMQLLFLVRCRALQAFRRPRPQQEHPRR